MNKPAQLTRTEIAAMVLSSLQGVLSQQGDSPAEPMGESTYLFGSGAFLDSLGLVTLIVDLEQRLEDEYGLSLTLADERAMSQKNSPFRTVRALADHIRLLVEEAQQDGRP
jgi:acyl carrier protein